MLFPRDLISVPPGGDRDIPGIEKIWLNTSCGKVESWFIPPKKINITGPAPTVIFAHGNGELIDFWPDELQEFTDLGLGVLLVEYPGYGRSEGAPSQRTITEAFVAAYDLIIARKDVDPSKIILFGRSVGGAAVCALAVERPSAALILMSSFISVKSFASKYLVPSFFVRDSFDNLAIVRSYPGPVLVIHGNNDEIIPYEHGVTLYKAAQNGKMITYNSGHNDCPPSWNTFWRDIESFLSQINIINNTS